MLVLSWALSMERMISFIGDFLLPHKDVLNLYGQRTVRYHSDYYNRI